MATGNANFNDGKKKSVVAMLTKKTEEHSELDADSPT